MTPFDPDWQQDLPQQLAPFDQFLSDTSDVYARRQAGQHGLSYDEAELDAFYYGWNAAKKYYGGNQ